MSSIRFGTIIPSTLKANREGAKITSIQINGTNQTFGPFIARFSQGDADRFAVTIIEDKTSDKTLKWGSYGFNANLQWSGPHTPSETDVAKDLMDFAKLAKPRLIGRG
jgi:hypothetical protein